MSNGLPAEGKFPIHFVTGVSFAHTREEQQRWQSMHERNVDRLLASLARSRRTRHRPSSPIMREFMANNLFKVA